MRTTKISIAALVAIFMLGLIISASAQQATDTQAVKPAVKKQMTPPVTTAKQAADTQAVKPEAKKQMPPPPTTAKQMGHMDMKSQKPAITVSKNMREGKDIMQTLEEMPNFKMFVTAIKTAGLADSYKGAGPFTVFAPNDDAFNKLPKEKLDALMKNKIELMYLVHNHAIHAEYMASAIKNMKSARSMHSAELKFMPMGDGMMVDNANITKADIACSNGVIHEIDTVLIPPAPGKMENPTTAKSPIAPAEKK